jgi:hypothetical protein
MSANGGGGGVFPPSTVVRMVSVTLSTTSSGFLRVAFDRVAVAVVSAGSESSCDAADRVTAV